MLYVENKIVYLQKYIEVVAILFQAPMILQYLTFV